MGYAAALPACVIESTTSYQGIRFFNVLISNGPQRLTQCSESASPQKPRQFPLPIPGTVCHTPSLDRLTDGPSVSAQPFVHSCKIMSVVPRNNLHVVGSYSVYIPECNRTYFGATTSLRGMSDLRDDLPEAGHDQAMGRMFRAENLAGATAGSAGWSHVLADRCSGE
jgi:hypothetical protein